MSETISGEAIAERIIRLGRELQARGADVALAEMIDAGQAAAHIDLGSRSELREALRATLVKTPRHYPEFEAAFERLFPRHPAGQRPSLGPLEDAGRLVDAVMAADDLRGVAADLVDEHGGFDGETRGERHHVLRVLRAADLARMISDARRQDPDLDIRELRARVDELKRLVTADVRARLGDTDRTDEIAGDITDVEFRNASRAELEDMRAAIRPLARKLASRLARRRQSLRTGRVNMRRTLRHSLESGGVPLDLSYQRPRAHRTELFVLCDISGSVAEFSLFTLTLMAALSAELGQTRSFVFVDEIDEVTGLLAATEHGIEPWQLLRNTNVIGAEGHSDYGAVLRRFWDEVGERELRPTSTVLVTGDARTNYKDAAVEVLAQIAQRCRHLFWLNPDPRDEWDTFDSEMAAYGARCTEVFEVRNLRQLVACVESIL